MTSRIKKTFCNFFPMTTRNVFSHRLFVLISHGHLPATAAAAAATTTTTAALSVTPINWSGFQSCALKLP
jgi:hypothetical protein